MTEPLTSPLTHPLTAPPADDPAARPPTGTAADPVPLGCAPSDPRLPPLLARLSLTPLPCDLTREERAWRGFWCALASYLLDEDPSALAGWAWLAEEQGERLLAARAWASYYLAHAHDFYGDTPRAAAHLAGTLAALGAGLQDPFLGALSRVKGERLLCYAEGCVLEAAALSEEEEAPVDLLAPSPDPRAPGPLPPAHALPSLLESAELLAGRWAWGYALSALTSALSPPLALGARAGWGARLSGRELPPDLLPSCLARLDAANPDVCFDLGLALFHGGDLHGAARCNEALLPRASFWRARGLVNLLGVRVSLGDLGGGAALEPLLTPDLRAALDDELGALWDGNIRLLRLMQGRLYEPSSLSSSRERISARGDAGQWEGVTLLEAHLRCARGELHEARALWALLDAEPPLTPVSRWRRCFYRARALWVSVPDDNTTRDDERARLQEARALCAEARALAVDLSDTLALNSLELALWMSPPHEEEALARELEGLLLRATGGAPGARPLSGVEAAAAGVVGARLLAGGEARGREWLRAACAGLRGQGAWWDLARVLGLWSSVEPEDGAGLERAREGLLALSPLLEWAEPAERERVWEQMRACGDEWLRRALLLDDLGEAWRAVYTLKACGDLPPRAGEPPRWARAALDRACADPREPPAPREDEGRGAPHDIFHDALHDAPHDDHHEDPPRPEVEALSPPLAELLAALEEGELALDLWRAPALPETALAFWARRLPGAPPGAPPACGLLWLNMEGEGRALEELDALARHGWRAPAARVEAALFTLERLWVGAALRALRDDPAAPLRAPPRLLTLCPPLELRGAPLHLSRCPRTERGLAERLTLLLTPHLSTLRRRALLPPPPARPRAALLLRGADGDRPLPRADEEAALLRALFSRVGVELRARLDPAAPPPDVIHFMGHARLGAREVLLSLDGAEVSAEELARAIAPWAARGGAPVVVISACGGGAVDPEAPPAWDLSARCLSAGARAVICALWEVPDDAAALLGLTLHAALLSGLPPSRALGVAVEETRARWPELHAWGAWALYAVGDAVGGEGREGRDGREGA